MLILLRLASALHTQEAGPQINWASQESIVLEISLTPRHESPPLQITCRQFIPRSEDITAKYGSFTDPVPVPLYAAIDAKALKCSLVVLTQWLRCFYVNERVQQGASEIVVETLQTALNYAVRLISTSN